MKTSPEKNLVRPARIEEARLLSDLALRSKAHWGYSSEFIEACRDELSYSERELSSGQMHFFVVESACSVVGFYALARLSGTEYELHALFVEPAFIGKGFGRILVEHAKAEASTMGATSLRIQGDPNAERFYRAAGGVLTGSKESGSIPGRFLPTFLVDLSDDAA